MNKKEISYAFELLADNDSKTWKEHRARRETQIHHPK